METYSVVSHQWEAQTLDFSRDISDLDVLLYRICGVQDGIGMSQEVLLLSHQSKPRKRPADFGAELTLPGRSVRPRITPLNYGVLPKTPKRPQRLPEQSLAITPASSIASDLSGSSPRSPSSDKFDATSDPFSVATSPENTATWTPPESGQPLPSSAPHQSSPEVIDLTEDSLVPTSKRSLWPLRSLKAMEKGFQKLDGLGGTLQQKFRVAFPNCGEHVKGTWYKHYTQVWCNARPDDIEKANGLWRSLVRIVERRLSSEKTPVIGKISIHQESTGKPLISEETVRRLLTCLAANAIHTCSYCSGQFPAHPSTALLCLQQSLLSGKSKSSSSIINFCIRHALEARYERQTPSWPTEIDWTTFGPRIEALREKLEVIWNSPTRSEFYDSALSIHKRGAQEVMSSGSSG